QANGVLSKQHQLSTAAREQECARGLAKAERGRRRDCRAQKRRDQAAKDRGATSGRAGGGRGQEAGHQGAATPTGGRSRKPESPYRYRCWRERRLVALPCKLCMRKPNRPSI